MSKNDVYLPSDWGVKEEKMMKKYELQKQDAKNYFVSCIKPRLDRSYKLYTSYNGDRAKEIKKWQCVSADTKILSASGWKSMGELKKGDAVLSYDVETGNILPDTVRSAFSYEVDGDMVSIKNSFTDQLVTTNHRVITKLNHRRANLKVKGKDKRERFWEEKYRYMEAGEILRQEGTDYRFPLGGVYDGTLSIGEDFAELIGWFLTDGCFPKKKGTPYITQSKPETLAKLRSLLISMKVNFREWSREKREGNYDEHRFYFSRKDDLTKRILKLIPDRKPVNSLWHLKLSEKRRLLEGIGYGDGSRGPNGSLHMVHKPYQQFKEWLQTFLHLMGMRSTITEKYVTVAWSPSLDVKRKHQIKLVKYAGKVWSISTGRTNYIACRNGKIFITGNSNIFVPYVHAVVETLMPRILDARPDFTVQGRTEDDQLKSEKIQNVIGYTWEVSKMDAASEDLVRSSLVFGNGFLEVSWKKDVRTHEFLSTKDLVKDKYKWEKREQVFYDAPFATPVDNYCLWYDWHNVSRETKQFWFKRRVIPTSVIKRDYKHIDKKRLKLALNGSGELEDYASIRNEIKLAHEKINKGSDHGQTSVGLTQNIYENAEDQDLKMHEVFEWWRPFDDAYAVMVNDVPILKGGFIPNPYDFKEAPFINIPYLKMPNEFEGIGLPIILENPQIMLNMIKNQRIDAATMSIHKMWIVNPMANVDTKELVVRPFGIVYSPDPSGVREVQFSDIKASAYKEEDLLKSDMRYASGVDDFSMGAGADVGSATAVRHLRESTLERVRLFINHLGEGYSVLMRYWMSMHRQFFTKDMTIRIIGEDGNEMFPLIEKDDLQGEFDFIAAVLPAIAGKNDIDKKQGMDLFQLLVNLPFVDPQKLTSKVLRSWNWSLESLKKKEEEGMPGVPGMEGAEGLPPEMAAMMGQQQEGAPMMEEGAAGPPNIGSGDIPPSVIQQALAMLGERGGEAPPAFGEAGMPINLLKAGVMPPTVAGVGKTTNPRGFNRGGAVNTNIPLKAPNGDSAQLLNQAANLQR